MSRRLILIGGSAGTGKSTVSRLLATRLGAEGLQRELERLAEQARIASLPVLAAPPDVTTADRIGALLRLTSWPEDSCSAAIADPQATGDRWLPTADAELRHARCAESTPSVGPVGGHPARPRGRLPSPPRKQPRQAPCRGSLAITPTQPTPAEPPGPAIRSGVRDCQWVLRSLDHAGARRRR